MDNIGNERLASDDPESRCAQCAFSELMALVSYLVVVMPD